MHAIESEGLKYVDFKIDCKLDEIEEYPDKVKAWSALRRARVKYFGELIEHAVSDLPDS